MLTSRNVASNTGMEVVSSTEFGWVKKEKAGLGDLEGNFSEI